MKKPYTFHYKLLKKRPVKVEVGSVQEAVDIMRSMAGKVVEGVPVVQDRSRKVVAILKV